MNRWLARHKDTIAIVLFFLLILAAGYYLVRQPPAGELIVLGPDEATIHVRQLKVSVTGEVKQPGVYSFRVGDRVAEAIELAGGASQQADLGHLDLARRLADEDSIVVPAKRGQDSADERRLNLNTASEAELEALPSIGPVTANKIIERRQSAGDFTNVGQLLELKLINKGQYEAIRDLVTVR